MNKFLSNEKGSILVSVVLFMSVTSMMVTGISYLVKNQAIQFKQIQQSYEAKAALAMSEELLTEKLKESGDVASGKIQFNSANIDIVNMGQNKYEFTAHLKDGYTFSKIVNLSAVRGEDELNKEELPSEKSISKENKQEENSEEEESDYIDEENKDSTSSQKIEVNPQSNQEIQ